MDNRNNRTSFLNLPTQLRNKIYLVALPANQVIHITKKQPRAPDFVNFTNVNHQVAGEPNGIYFGSNILRASSLRSARTFLKDLDRRCRQMIRSLQL